MHLNHITSPTDGRGHAGYFRRPDPRRSIQHHRLQPQCALLEWGSCIWLLHSDCRCQEIYPEHQTQWRCEVILFFCWVKGSLIALINPFTLTSVCCLWHKAPTSMKPWWEQFRCCWRRLIRVWSTLAPSPWSFWCLMETPQLVRPTSSVSGPV